MYNRLLPLLLVLLLLFSACSADIPQETKSFENTIQTSAVVPNSENALPIPDALEISAEERCAITGNCKFAETENGYYMLRSDYLFYADKADLSNWIIVCNKPNCSHSVGGCNAYIGNFWLTNDGILYVTDNIDYKDLDGHYFVKRNLDTSSPQLVFTDPILHGDTNGATLRTDFGEKDCFYRCISAMQEDGNWNCLVLKADTQGVKTLFSSDYPPSSNGSIPQTWISNQRQAIRGDLILNSQFPLDGTLDENKENWASRERNLFYQVHNDTIRSLDIPETCDIYGSYISGNSFWHYHMNDGFYYMDLSTGEEVKIADAAYVNAYGHCIDGKHMVECSLSVPGYSRDSTEAKMRYFDSEVWHELELPEHWNALFAFRVLAASSDRIFFTVDDYDIRRSDSEEELCYIVLGDDEITVCDKYPYHLSFD